MAKKMNYELRAEKNTVPQGAWLAWHYVVNPETGDMDAEPVYAAFTTAAAAKRYLASVLGRSRINWTDVEGDKTSFSATVRM